LGLAAAKCGRDDETAVEATVHRMSVTRLFVGDDGSPAAAVARSWAGQLAAASDGHLASSRVGADDSAASAAAALLTQATEHDADLIVVGRRGTGGFPKLQLGSTAHQVAEHSTVPVAVVPPFDAPPRGTWPFARISVGVDGSPAAAGAAAWAASLAVSASAELWAVHALDLGPAFAVSGLDEAAYANALRSMSRLMEDEWCRPFQEAGIRYKTVLEEGGAAAVLLDAVVSAGADLLVVGRRGSGNTLGAAMGSVAHRAIAFAPCTTVVVPAPN
jgi:nucleotide-binding universal stress UspA family protein